MFRTPPPRPGNFCPPLEKNRRTEHFSPTFDETLSFVSWYWNYSKTLNKQQIVIWFYWIVPKVTNLSILLSSSDKEWRMFRSINSSRAGINQIKILVTSQIFIGTNQIKILFSLQIVVGISIKYKFSGFAFGINITKTF